MESGLCYLTTRYDDEKRLRREFSDKRIRYGFNEKNKRFEVWYKPENSAPYLVATPNNVQHAIYLLRQRLINDKIGAKILLKEIDEHNEKLVNDKQIDAMDECRHDLRNIASGRQIFTPSLARKRNLCQKTLKN